MRDRCDPGQVTAALRSVMRSAAVLLPLRRACAVGCIGLCGVAEALGDRTRLHEEVLDRVRIE